MAPTAVSRPPLYTPEQRKRRDETVWTIVQGVLAPAQFIAFIVSLVLVAQALTTGQHVFAASVSVVVKTGFLYGIMVTGAIWEKKVFGRYLFAPQFYWEDVFSMLVLALHTAYLWALFSGSGSARSQLILALCAFAAYVINAVQFILKLRAARLQSQAPRPEAAANKPPLRWVVNRSASLLRGCPSETQPHDHRCSS